MGPRRWASIAATLGLIVAGCSKPEPVPELVPVEVEKVRVELPPPPPLPAVFDPGDFASTARWVGVSYSPVVPLCRVVTSSLESNEAKDVAGAELRRLEGEIREAFSHRSATHVRWEAVVTEVGDAGVRVSISSVVPLGNPEDGKVPTLLVDAYLNHLDLRPGSPLKEDMSTVLKAGRQIGKEQVGRLRVGEKISVEGDVTIFLPDPPFLHVGLPNRVRIVLNAVHVPGFEPPEIKPYKDPND